MTRTAGKETCRNSILEYVTHVQLRENSSSYQQHPKATCVLALLPLGAATRTSAQAASDIKQLKGHLESMDWFRNPVLSAKHWEPSFPSFLKVFANFSKRR